jgi:hypothetical protein
MGRDRRIQFFSGLIAFICLIGMGVLNPRITASAGEHQLTYTTEAEEGLPPEVAVAIAMGAFRGIAVDFLWIRANRLKTDGKFYEAMQLADWITKLQPRFPKVWIFHAWNMSYNISVATRTEEERWQWVQAGIRLLREKGIPRNPNDMDMHKELAWIFLHKVSGITDDVNRYYKRQIARRWHIVLGEPPETKRERIAWLEEIAMAPDTLEQVIARHPRAAEIYAMITKEFGIPAGEPLLEFTARLDDSRYRFSARKLDYFGQLEEDREIAGSVLRLRPELIGEGTIDRLLKMRDGEGYKEAWETLVLQQRKRVLIDEYNMEPARMARYTEKYGPLDWRCAAAHALYWGQRGVEMGRTRQTLTDFDQVNADRIVIQSIQELRRYGEVDYDILTNEYILLPDLRFLPYYESILVELMQRDRTRANAYQLYRAGYFNFLRDAIRSYYAYGEKDKAQEYLTKLNREAAPHDDLWDHWQLKELELFMQKEMEERFTTSHVVNAHVSESLIGGFARLLQGDDEKFRRQIAYAKWAYDYYDSMQNRNTHGEDMNRMELPPFTEMLAAAFLQTFRNVEPVQKILLYRVAPEEIKLWAYDTMRAEWARQFGTDEGFTEQFPPPAGYRRWAQLSEEQRKTQRQRELERVIDFEMQ